MGMTLDEVRPHLVGFAANIGIFDINCMNNGSGWCAVEDWTSVIAPFLMAQYPRANGRWHITHAIEIDQSTLTNGDPSVSQAKTPVT